jgi:outer membrane protein assembly factor BamB
MIKHKWLLIILILVLVLIPTAIFSGASASSAGSSVDDWKMFRYDPTRSGSTNGSSANSVMQLWNYSTSASVTSSPAIADGLVVVGCKDCNIYCLNASSGKLVWKYPVGNEVDSSPAIENGLAYVGCDDGYIYCINISTGKQVWASKVGGMVRSCPAVTDGKVYIGSREHDLFCLNASTGDSIWTFPTQYGVESSPAVYEGIVYFACDDHYVWSVNASTGEEVWHHWTGSDQSSPCVYNGGIYIGSYDGYVIDLNASTGHEVWNYQTQNSIVSSPAAAYGYIVVGSEDNSVYCFNASSGKMVWKTPTGYWILSSPAIVNGNVYVGSEDYNLYCLDVLTGQVNWAYATRSIIDSSPAIVNDTLYVGSSDYHVYAFTLYNSTAEPLVTAPIAGITSWHVFLFDDISFVVGVIVLFVIARWVYLTIRNKKQPKAIDASNQTQSWFLSHVNLVCALIILGFAVAFFVSLSAGPLWAADEKTYSQMAYHMFRSGDYLLPWIYGEPAIWAGKPPLLMWLMSLAYQVFGINNFAARIWSALFGVLSLVVVFHLGRKLYNPQVGLLSVVVLGTFTTFYAFATHAMTDGPLVFFILASVYFVLLSEEKPNTKRYAVLSGLFFGLALMTKQIEALLIPIIIIAYLAVTKRSLRFLFTKRFALFCAVALLIFMPYVIYMGFSFKDFWDCYFIYSDFSRIVAPLEGHVGGYLFYFEYLVTSENLLWVLLLPFAVGLCVFNAVVKRVKGDTLVLVWVAVVLVIFTLAQTKIYWYILPALPAFAIAISNLLNQLAHFVGLRRKNSGNLRVGKLLPK